MAEAAPAEAEYQLVYHPFLARGAFAVIQLVYAGASFSWSDDIKSVGMAHGCAESKVFAVPVLKHGSLVLSQTNTIVRYLADKLGLAPPTKEGDYIADSLMALIQDAFMPLFDLKKETSEEDKNAFFGGRFKLFMDVFTANLNENGVFFGDGTKFTSIDLNVAFYLKIIDTMLGEAKFKEYLSTPYPQLAALYTNVFSDPKIKAYFDAPEKPIPVQPIY